MTDTRHTQPRCAICRWPYRPDGCTPGNCCFRPHEGTSEYAAQVARFAVWDRLVAAGNPAPTLEDVDAELAPRGLPVIELDSPAWVGPWTVDDFFRERLLLHPEGSLVGPTLLRCSVARRSRDVWHYGASFTRAAECPREGYPTPEAAQQACEAAIVAAWRNR